MEQTSNDNVFECSTFIDIEIAHYKNRGKSMGLIQTCSGITHGRVLGMGLGLKLVSHACSENGGKRAGRGGGRISLVARTLIYDNYWYFLMISRHLSEIIMLLGDHTHTPPPPPTPPPPSPQPVCLHFLDTGDKLYFPPSLLGWV